MVLLLGPLYHLVDQRDRLTALGEALRVLRPGGVLVAAAISRWGSALDGLARELFRDADFARIVERDLVDGQHRNPTPHLDYFTTAYFHRPEELRQEVSETGFDVDAVYGVEGPAWILPDLMERWGDTARREMVLDVARKLESEPSVVGCSAHILAVGRKRNAS
jgi:SAM-dependent methyltransferase